MTRQYSPQLDWTPDAKLPTRFAAWKSEIEDEVLLFEGEDKPLKYICNFVKVCSGERGKAILRESNAHKEEKDYQLSKSLSCGWCGGRKRCRRQECPAKDSKCNKCGKMGHWGKVCRMKNRAGNVKTRVHRIMDSNDHDQSDEDDATSVDFDSLNTFPDPKDPHLHPLWFSDPQKSDIHLIEAEVDSGAGCNTFPLYVYIKRKWQASMDHYNRHAKERDELQELQRVWFKKEPTANWKPATVIERPSDSPRAYIVQDDAGTYFQETSKHVRPAAVLINNDTTEHIEHNIESLQHEDLGTKQPTLPGDAITRSGRISRKSIRY
ncbi:hypothetical protein CAPTEDRAFT_190792 [Capitella teleta]|uniref:CCHC-type domain-containing protein n=1 Tax=Capitella teleta TaxID=283909 RepID=R7TP88_CAPTE|nr:hypothetical protein CAPTEDRAFT_190792 [Capitella teleta]|eukprot:ELT95377.1 hypothetical protein CAPTEDRAFT_190792 [Capitella teleta]